MVLIIYLKLRNVENDLEVQVIFCIDKAADILLETGLITLLWEKPHYCDTHALC